MIHSLVSSENAIPLFMRDQPLMTRSLGIKVKTRLFFSDPDLDFYPDSLEGGEEQGQTPPM